MCLYLFVTKTRMTYRLFIALLTVTFATFLLAACGQNQPTPTPAPPPTEARVGGLVAASTRAADTTVVVATPAPTVAPTATPVTGHIVLWHSWSQAEGDALAAALEQFKAEQPG